MEIRPVRAAPGQEVALHFPEATVRGVAFRLDERVGQMKWGPRFWLVAPSSGGKPEWARLLGSFGWDDIGVAGPGPDRLVIPPPTQPGHYRICTVNATKEMCDLLEVRK